MFIFSLNLKLVIKLFENPYNLKILHTADWHMDKLFSDSTGEAFFDWINAHMKKLEIDALLITGDVFNVANPSAQTQKQFYRFIKKTTTSNPGLQIVVIAGNHASIARLETPIPLLGRSEHSHYRNKETFRDYLLVLYL